MGSRVITVAAVLLSAVALIWLLRPADPTDEPGAVTVDSPVDSSPGAVARTELPARAAPQSPATSGDERVQRLPVDVDARAHFNEQARAFFANVPQLTAEERLSEARQLEHELTRLEQAGGLSAGETLLIRAGLIRETVAAGPQQDAQLRELQERYQNETQRRIASAQAHPDPLFDSYKVRESEIVNEVMAMQTIPDGLSRDEYPRRRLQSAREQLTTQ